MPKSYDRTNKLQTKEVRILHAFVDRLSSSGFFDFTIPERIAYCLFIGVIIFYSEKLIYNRECKEYSKYLNDQNNMSYHEAQKRSVNENIAIYKEVERERQARDKWWKF